MEEEWKFITKVESNIARGMQGQPIVEYSHEVKEEQKNYRHEITLRVGGVLVWSRFYGTKFNGEKERIEVRMKAIGQLLMEVPFLYLAVKRNVKEEKNMTVEDLTVKGLRYLKKAWNQIEEKGVL